MGNTFTNLLYHIVFSTKNRKGIIKDDFRDELYLYLGGIIRGEKGKSIAIGGTLDHVHILAKFSQAVTVSYMLQHNRFYWQRGYSAFTVSESMVEIVTRYIEGQQEHHKKMTFKEELLMLLEKHNIEYDEKDLWN